MLEKEVMCKERWEARAKESKVMGKDIPHKHWLKKTTEVAIVVTDKENYEEGQLEGTKKNII